MKHTYRYSIVFVLHVFISAFLIATPPSEGMWIPLLLESMNEAEMQEMGMKMTAEDIYSVNQSSLKDAVVSIGGCTAEVISDQGLLLTNHHCGFGRIRSHSTVERDYLKEGFWAGSLEEELPNPNMTATFIIRIEDVTKKVLDGITDDTNAEERAKIIARHTQEIINEATKDSHYRGSIRPFYEGNEYYLFITEVFEDVRLVGAPPSSIGNFGGDTDNWIWPRHTGDFSLFRIYADADGKPAAYSEENVPYKPRRSFNISLKGVKENDFTMVYGFPGRTEQYLPSYAVEMIMKIQDPVRIKLRELRLEAMKEEMKKSDLVNLQYANKARGISNGYKKWQGELRGLTRNRTLDKKRDFEAAFTKLVRGNPDLSDEYGTILNQYQALYDEFSSLWYNMLYFDEGGSQIEIVDVAWRMAEAIGEISGNPAEDNVKEELERLRKFGDRFFKDYNQTIDRNIMTQILSAYSENIENEKKPEIITAIEQQFAGDFEAYTNYIFNSSSFGDQQSFNTLLSDFSIEKVQSDPAFNLMASLYQTYFTFTPRYNEIRKELNELDREYMEAIRVVFPDSTYFPDANSTLRVTYGKVQSMQPSDGVSYKYYTTLSGVIAKGIPNDFDFHIPPKLIELYNNKDFGRYAQDGDVRVCFIASNHTSGGNSGSPVIDAEGNLIGLNFDRNWEGTMSDINYDINQCRNISVDIRYVLFLIDKFAGATRLIEEMNLIE
ncbi:MAG: S46 family peptidase [Bacteroidetes bacterium]|nr:S46 family peptidase [Bacteroidota bacterium]